MATRSSRSARPGLSISAIVQRVGCPSWSGAPLNRGNTYRLLRWPSFLNTENKFETECDHNTKHFPRFFGIAR